MFLDFFARFILLLLSLCALSCSRSYDSTDIAYATNKTWSPNNASLKTRDTSQLERLFIKKNLVNINSLDSTIRVALIYSTSQNFLNKPLYNGLNQCYLPCDVAIKLCNAQLFLKTQFPNYNLIVFDAVRPLHIQKKMWDELQIPVEQKINYLAHPNDLSLHNYGAAVDVGIIGQNDVLLDMGTPFDFFGELSEPKKEKLLLENGKLTKHALTNRLILRNVMVRAGFTTIPTEWWHFNSTNKTTAAIKYQLIE